VNLIQFLWSKFDFCSWVPSPFYFVCEMCCSKNCVFLLVFVAASCFSRMIFTTIADDFSFPRTDSFFTSSPARAGQGFGSHVEFAAESDFHFWCHVFFTRFLCMAEFPFQGPPFQSGGQHSPRTESLPIFSTTWSCSVLQKLQPDWLFLPPVSDFCLPLGARPADLMSRT
jgi:hypothetical protein